MEVEVIVRSIDAEGEDERLLALRLRVNKDGGNIAGACGKDARRDHCKQGENEKRKLHGVGFGVFATLGEGMSVVERESPH